MPKIITRAKARAHGLKRYFTGKPCCRSHIAERHVNPLGRVECRYQYKRRHARTPNGRGMAGAGQSHPEGQGTFPPFRSESKGRERLAFFAQSSKGRARTAIQSKPERT
jgi:hypothetical protein